MSHKDPLGLREKLNVRDCSKCDVRRGINRTRPEFSRCMYTRGRSGYSNYYYPNYEEYQYKSPSLFVLRCPFPVSSFFFSFPFSIASSSCRLSWCIRFLAEGFSFLFDVQDLSPLPPPFSDCLPCCFNSAALSLSFSFACRRRQSNSTPSAFLIFSLFSLHHFLASSSA